MKNIISSAFVVATLSGIAVSSVLAENGSHHDWAEKAAQKYEMKSKEAASAGNEADAKIYSRMAEIKRDAGAAAKEGKKFDWGEYHTLASQLNKDDKVTKDKAVKKGKYSFTDAAEKYTMKAGEALKAGNEADAKIYARLAEIKQSAARGEVKSWDEYHSLVSQLRTHQGKQAKFDK